jgi:hypothetical protein
LFGYVLDNDASTQRFKFNSHKYVSVKVRAALF